MTAFVFVDSRVPGYEDLLAGLPSGAEVVVLGAERDGVGQIAPRRYWHLPNADPPVLGQNQKLDAA